MTDTPNEFERGVRAVLEHTETYTQQTGDMETQFGVYQLTMVPRGEKMLTSSKHLERRIQAILHLDRLV